MRRALLLIILFLSTQVLGQIEASTNDFNFGELYSGSQTYTDITFTNETDKVQWLLTIDKPRDVYYIFSSKQVQPGESITIRFKINDAKKGKFNYSVDVYFSEPRDPITVKLSGNVKQMTTETSLTACPDFNAAPPKSMTEFDLVIRVIDSTTREAIPNATVYLVSNGELIGTEKTNFKGFVKERMNIGYYYITADRSPYNSNYYEGYVNYKRNYIEIELSQYPDPVIEEPVVEEPVIEEPPVEEPEVEEPVVEEPPTEEPVEEFEIVIEEDPPVEEPVVEEPVVEEPVVEEPVIEEPPPVEPVALDELPDTNFNQAYFKYNNITFILDVSSSMNGMGKMNLLKMSMIELAKILRPQDVVSIVKFASDVDVIMPGSSGDKKEEIISTVKGLKTASSTAGGDAISKGYQLNRQNYIPGGNNMVIMITDGIFNKGSKDYLNVVKKNYEDKGIKFCVVGIKTSDYITKHMTNIVSYGGGDFIRIITVDDAMNKLIEEIRKSSFRF